MNKIRTYVIVSLICFSIINIANAQVEKIKAAYIYNFAAMTNYPSSAQGGDFVIAVIGSDPIITELESISKTKKVGAQSIVIKKISSPGEIGNAQMVFVPDNQKAKFGDVISKTSSTHTVVVAESAGSCSKGAIFNLLLVDQRCVSK